MNKAILVAGGAGYIGAHVCKILAASGYLPVTLDTLITGKQESVQWGPLINACVSDADAVRHVVWQYNITAVIDLAGSIEVAESVRDPLKYYQNNFAVKLGFLKTLQQCRINAFVFSSTAAVYGEPVSHAIEETHQLLPKNPYGASKLAFERALADMQQAGGPAWTALRYFNAAGASPDGEIGECHEPETHLIPRACLAALGIENTLDIFGTDYPTPDGTAVRDYVHVMDLAQAHVQAIEALCAGAPPAAYNLGTGTGTSVKEVLASFARLDYTVPHQFKARREGDPAYLVASATRAKQLLGWKPRYSDSETVIRTAYQWQARKNKR